MPIYPIHPCCYCYKTEAGNACKMSQKVDCHKYLGYLKKLSDMRAQPVLIKELVYLITTNKVPRLNSGQGGK
jgi:hypothetical protein